MSASTCGPSNVVGLITSVPSIYEPGLRVVCDAVYAIYSCLPVFKESRLENRFWLYAKTFVCLKQHTPTLRIFLEGVIKHELQEQLIFCPFLLIHHDAPA